MRNNNNILYNKIIYNISKEVKRILIEGIQNFDVADYSEDDTIDNHSVNNVLWDFPYADELNDIFTDINWTRYNIVNRDFADYIRIYNGDPDSFVLYQLSNWFRRYTKENEYDFDSVKDGIDSTTAFIYDDNNNPTEEFGLYILGNDSDYLEYMFSTRYDAFQKTKYTLFTVDFIPSYAFSVHCAGRRVKLKKIPIEPVKLINFYLNNEINLKFGGEKELRYGKLVNP